MPQQIRAVHVAADSIDLEWLPADGGGSQVEQYIAEATDTPGQWENAIRGACEGLTGLRIMGLAADTQYLIRVRARNRSGFSPWHRPPLRVKTQDYFEGSQVQAYGDLQFMRLKSWYNAIVLKVTLDDGRGKGAIYTVRVR